jgi:hypothetical protein
MNKRQEWLERIKAVELEYLAVSEGLALLAHAVRSGGRPLADRLNPSHLQTAGDNLEDTYLIRLYAVFESGLRDAWKDCFRRRSKPKAEDLLNAVAALRSIAEDDRDNAHSVRRYRNGIVHEGGEEAEAVSLGRAKSYLCLFFSRLPLTW